MTDAGDARILHHLLKWYFRLHAKFEDGRLTGQRHQLARVRVMPSRMRFQRLSGCGVIRMVSLVVPVMTAGRPVMPPPPLICVYQGRQS